MNIKFKIIGSTVCISTDNGYKPINFKTYNTERLTLENIIEECDNKIKENNDKQNNIKRKRKRNIKTLDIITTILTSLALISINNYTTIFAILYSIISGIILGISTTTIFNFFIYIIYYFYTIIIYF